MIKTNTRYLNEKLFQGTKTYEIFSFIMSVTSTAPSIASGGLPTGSSAISPASEDSNMSNDNSNGDNDTCLQLALEGEKL